MNATIKNVLKDTIISNEKKIKVWKVIVMADISDGQAVSTYYIDMETREILR